MGNKWYCIVVCVCWCCICLLSWWSTEQVETDVDVVDVVFMDLVSGKVSGILVTDYDQVSELRQMVVHYMSSDLFDSSMLAGGSLIEPIGVVDLLSRIQSYEQSNSVGEE